MSRLNGFAIAAVACMACVTACEEPAVEASSEAPTAPAASEPEPAAQAVAESLASEAEQGLSPTCTKLISCCDAWVQTTPTARVGCDAQRQAFRAAKTPETKRDLEGLCKQALEAWAQLPGIPEICK